MNSTVIKIENLKIENVRLSPPKVNKRGGKNIYINYVYNTNEQPKKLRIQLPFMKAPFGVSGFSVGPDGKSSSIPNEESSDAIELAFSGKDDIGIGKIEKLEALLVNHAFDNSKEYFNKKKSLDACKMFFTSGVKYDLDEDGMQSDMYPPRIRCKMGRSLDNVYSVQIYDPNKQKVAMDLSNHNEVITKMSECCTIIDCAGWVVGEKFGISFRPAQMKVKKNETALNDYAFIEDESDENNDDDDTADKMNSMTFEEPNEEYMLDPLEPSTTPRRRS